MTLSLSANCRAPGGKAIVRRLQPKTANELGEEGEVDVYEALRREFPHDIVTRVAKGVPGADIIHRIVHNDTIIGTILVDSKNTSRFLSRYDRVIGLLTVSIGRNLVTYRVPAFARFRPSAGLRGSFPTQVKRSSGSR